MSLDATNAEKALLGSIIEGGVPLMRVVDIVSAADFESAAHAEVFRSILALAPRADRIELVMVAEELRRAGKLASVGGPVELSNLASAAPFAENATHYASIVREASIRRKALETLRLVADALKRGVPLAEVSQLERSVGPILDGLRGRVRETHGDTMRIVDRAAEAWTNGKRVSLSTGWRDFDEVLRLVPNLHGIGAHGGVGKSALIAGLVRQWTRAHVKTGVLAYEDDGFDLQQRILACDAGLSLAHLDGDIQPDECGFAMAEKAALERVSLEPYLLVDDAGRGTLAEALKSIREMAARGVQVAVLDNLSCVRMDIGDDARQRLAIEESLLELREAAKTLKIPVIVVGHLKRGQSDADELHKRPKLTDFAGSAAWDRFCRSACGMWWENNQVRLKVLKQTKGRVGDEFVVYANSEAATVVNIERAPAEEPRSMLPREPYKRGVRS